MAVPDHRSRKRRTLSLLGAFPDMRDWGSGPGLGGWGAEGAPGASATRPDRSADRQLLEAIGERVRAIREVDPFDVEVRVESGDVKLVGTVPERAMRQLIEQAVLSTAGVATVTNELRITPIDPDAMGSE